ncbi:MYND domain protein [Lasiodiplodia theobromae]|nr:MYND domain protein [Lasiodiplodia theobromae]
MDDSNNTQATATTCARCADWKTHKKVCASLAAAASNGASTSTSKNLDVPIPNPFTRLTQRTWLHDRSERDTYKLLIDAYRLRMEDDYNFTGDVDADCVMGGAPDSARGFARSSCSACSASRRTCCPRGGMPRRRRSVSGWVCVMVCGRA